MAYDKQEWTHEDWLKGRYNVQEKLNHMEDGIEEASGGGSAHLYEHRVRLIAELQGSGLFMEITFPSADQERITASNLVQKVLDYALDNIENPDKHNLVIPLNGWAARWESIEAAREYLTDYEAILNAQFTFECGLLVEYNGPNREIIDVNVLGRAVIEGAVADVLALPLETFEENTEVYDCVKQIL